MDDELQDPVWKLLGEARQPLRPSPFFSRNVLRRVRNGTREEPVRWLPRWVPAAAFACVVAGFASSLVVMPGDVATVDARGDWIEYFDVAAGIDELVPSSEFTLAWFAGVPASDLPTAIR